jgi:DNA-binding MarR family transcriptional regulator
MNDKRPDPRKGRRGSLISLDSKGKPGVTPRNGPPPGEASDDCWPVLVEFALSLRGWWIGICDDFGLTPMQGHALRSLDPDRPSPMSVLADMLICDASNVTAIVDKLESRGLIVRQGAENDRRIKMLAVTPQGRELRERLCARFTVAPAAVESMPPLARRQLADLLRAILSERTAAATGG